MITTTGIVFSLTVLSLQIASSQFSVRLLRTFLRDVPNQVVLAIFVCTFAYATGGLLTVGEHAAGGEFVPKVAVTGSLALAFISIGALIFFLHHLVHSIQIDTIMEGVQRRTLALVDDLFPDPDTPEPDQPTPPKPPTGAVPLLAPKSGYLQTVDVGDLADLASATATFRATCRVRRRLRHGRQQRGLVLAQGSRLTTPPIPMCCNAFCGMCTSGSSGHSSRTSVRTAADGGHSAAGAVACDQRSVYRSPSRAPCFGS